MGSHWFETYADGPEAGPAFTAAVDEACWEHGDGGYTGTIAEKTDFLIIATPPVGHDDAVALARTLQDDPRVKDTWGPAGAIAVTQPDTTAPQDGPALPPSADGTHKPCGWLFFGWASS